jgi:iron complex outermembrane recepter protein
MRASAERSFKGIGPSLSWNATMPIAGDVQKGELDLDWGINGSILFGKQKANIHHHTTARYFKSKYYHSFITPGGYRHHDHYQPLYDHNGGRDQSRSGTVPNIGANIGLSYRIENTKISLGYRTDNFFGAMDGGIDKAKRTTLSFNGLYASVSVGIGD